MRGIPDDIYTKSTDEIQRLMLTGEGPDSIIYTVCLDALHHKSTQNLVEETQKLAKWTMRVAVGTGILAIATWALVLVSKG